ncbi:hypothetical protein PAMA_013607 [Pampus argenteus]
MTHVLNLHLIPSLLVLLQALCLEGHFKVIGPPQPIVATVGGDIILPCQLVPDINVLDKTVEWTRPDLNPRFVYVWRDGVELESKKHWIYKGRTSMSIDNMKHGDISLKLSKVKLSDQGRYRCRILTLGDSFTELVAVAVSSPVIVGIYRTSSGVILQCESKGWYPEPEVFWLDGERKLLSAGPTETVRGPDDLYTVISRVTVEKRHSNNFTCRVQQNHTNQTRETHIQISDDFFKPPSTSSVCIITICVFGSIFVLCGLAFVAWWKWKQQKSRTQAMKPDPLFEGESDKVEYLVGKEAMEDQNK